MRKWLPPGLALLIRAPLQQARRLGPARPGFRVLAGAPRRLYPLAPLYQDS